MKRLLTFLFLFQTSAWACELLIPAKILVLSKQVREINNLKPNNCREHDLQSLYKLLENSKGRVSIAQLREKLSLKLKSPSPFLEIVHLKDLLKMKVSDQRIRNNYSTLKTASKQDAFLLNEDQYVKVDCYNCSNVSGTTINYKISFQDSSTKKHKIVAKMVQTQSFRVYRAIRDIAVFRGNLSADAFESVVLETERPRNYFEDMPAINFLKTTRPIKKGEVILKSHFAYKNVIKMGQVVTIELKNNNISLITHGKAMQTGKINQTIQVKSLNSKKIYSAKITEPGKAEVTL